MLITALTHIAALVAGYLAGLIVNLVVGSVNVAIAGVMVAASSGFLLKRGVPIENVERLNAETIASFFFITGIMEGIAKIAIALVVFRWFEREMGWIMVLLLVAFQLIPRPAMLGEQNRSNLRSGSAGAILGLIATWLVVPK